MKRRLTTLIATLVLAGSLQVVAAPTASACADPHCPWSPVTEPVKELVQRVVDRVDELCDQATEPGCPL